jgi:hypothetical protein
MLYAKFRQYSVSQDHVFRADVQKKQRKINMFYAKEPTKAENAEFLLHAEQGMSTLEALEHRVFTFPCLAPYSR